MLSIPAFTSLIKKVVIISNDWQLMTVSLLIQCLPVKIVGDLKVNYNPPILSLTPGCKLSQAYSNHYYWQTAIVWHLNQSRTRSQTHQPITSKIVKRLANWLDIGFLLWVFSFYNMKHNWQVYNVRSLYRVL